MRGLTTDQPNGHCAEVCAPQPHRIKLLCLASARRREACVFSTGSVFLIALLVLVGLAVLAAVIGGVLEWGWGTVRTGLLQSEMDRK